jgi:hypothetical protein
MGPLHLRLAETRVYSQKESAGGKMAKMAGGP